MLPFARRSLALIYNNRSRLTRALSCSQAFSVTVSRKPLHTSDCATRVFSTSSSFWQIPPEITNPFEIKGRLVFIPESDDVATITKEELEHSIQLKRTILFDVRTHEEAALLGKIPTAKVLPVQEMDSAMNLSPGEFKIEYGFYQPTPAGPSVIVYCRTGVRAAIAGRILTSRFGFKNVFNYKGSWKEWSECHPEDCKPLPEGFQYPAPPAPQKQAESTNSATDKPSSSESHPTEKETTSANLEKPKAA